MSSTALGTALFWILMLVITAIHGLASDTMYFDRETYQFKMKNPADGAARFNKEIYHKYSINWRELKDE